MVFYSTRFTLSHNSDNIRMSEKIKITKNEFYKINEEQQMILLTDEDRKKTDKVIQDLIGSYDDFIFTNEDHTLGNLLRTVLSGHSNV